MVYCMVWKHGKSQKKFKKLEATEMNVFRKTLGTSKKDKVLNEDVRQ